MNATQHVPGGRQGLFIAYADAANPMMRYPNDFTYKADLVCEIAVTQNFGHLSLAGVITGDFMLPKSHRISIFPLGVTV